MTGVSDDAAGEPTEPPVEGVGEGDLEAHLPAYRYGIVLGLLFATFIFMASGPSGSWVPFVVVVLQGATLLAALAASGASRRLWRIAVVVVVFALVSGTTVWTSGVDSEGGALFILNALLVAGAPVVIAIALIKRRVIDIQTVLGALCIYVLLGMLWAFIVRRDRRDRVGAVLRGDLDGDGRGLPLLQLRHPDDHRLRRPHRRPVASAAPSPSSKRCSASSTWSRSSR